MAFPMRRFVETKGPQFWVASGVPVQRNQKTNIRSKLQTCEPFFPFQDHPEIWFSNEEFMTKNKAIFYYIIAYNIKMLTMNFTFPKV